LKSFPSKILGAKNMQNLARFRTTSNFDGEYVFERNRLKKDRSRSTAIPPAFGEKQSDELLAAVISEIWRPNHTHLNRLFRKARSAPPKLLGLHTFQREPSIGNRGFHPKSPTNFHKNVKNWF